MYIFLLCGALPAYLVSHKSAYVTTLVRLPTVCEVASELYYYRNLVCYNKIVAPALLTTRGSLSRKQYRTTPSRARLTYLPT